MSEFVNNEYKDTLFKMLFGDSRENALLLYNAINGTSYEDTEDLVVTTIEDAVYISMRNDVSFLLKGDLNLYEHQSTFNPNMPLRGLEYFSIMYSNYVQENGGRRRLFGKSLVRIPTPKYCVFYNGSQDRPEREILKLSTAYEGEGDLEVTAHLFNINKGCNSEIMNKCRPLYEYAELVFRIRENQARGMRKEDAIESAVNSCLQDGIMKDILTKEKNRVMSSLLTELTAQEIEELYREEGFESGFQQGIQQGIQDGIQQGIQQGIEDGIRQGIRQGKQDTVLSFVEKGLIRREDAAMELGISVQELCDMLLEEKAE